MATRETLMVLELREHCSTAGPDHHEEILSYALEEELEAVSSKEDISRLIGDLATCHCEGQVAPLSSIFQKYLGHDGSVSVATADVYGLDEGEIVNSVADFRWEVEKVEHDWRLELRVWVPCSLGSFGRFGCFGRHAGFGGEVRWVEMLRSEP